MNLQDFLNRPLSQPAESRSVRQSRALPGGRLFVFGTLLMVLGSSALLADIAVLGTGDILKVDSYELLDDRMRLDLRGGGSMTLPIERIERIVDDEIVPEEELTEIEPVVFNLSFSESDPVPPGQFGQLIHEAARRHDLNPALIVAMTRAESAFDQQAVSVKGARGLMQLMPATAERFGVQASELFQPERNLEAGARYLKWLIERFGGDLPLVLAGYNAGEGAVDRYKGIPPYRETQGYVKKILGYLGLSGLVQG